MRRVGAEPVGFLMASAPLSTGGRLVQATHPKRRQKTTMTIPAMRQESRSAVAVKRRQQPLRREALVILGLG